MFKVDGRALEITRGDSGSFVVAANQYSFEDGDTVIFSARRKPGLGEAQIEKAVTEFRSGKAIVNLLPEDTRDLNPGRYYYSVRIVRPDGWTRTFIMGDDTTITIGKEC